VAQRYERYGDLKNDLAQVLIAEIEPITKRYFEYLNDPAELSRILHQGAQKASAVAKGTYERAAKAMGLLG
jgi:tryptophanyl-tRNA synthetase